MTVTFRLCVLLAIGGALGTLGRFFVGVLATSISRHLPWGTILINITGSFAIGFFGTLTLASGRYPVSEEWRLFFMVGVCGGYTTFSAFSLQTLELARNGALVRAGLNIVLSVVLCIVAVAVGHLAAAGLNGGAEAIAQADVEEEA